MKKRLVLISIAVLLITMFVGQSFGEQTTFVIGVEKVSYLPYYAEEDGEYVGLVRELLDAFAEKHNYQFIYKPLPIKRLHQDFLNHKVDFLYPDNPEWVTTLKQGVDITYSAPLVTVIDGVMVLPEHKGRSVEHLKILGTIMGYTAPAYDELIRAKHVKLVENAVFENLLKMVIEHRIDGAYVTVDPARYQLQTVLQIPDALVFDETLPYDKAEHLLSTIQHPQLISTFNDFLINEKRAIEQLKKKYHIQEGGQD